MKIDRLVSMILVLLGRERIGAQELADMFEVSPRTIYRDVDTINLAGIPVRSTSGAGGGFEIMKEYKMDKKVFTSDDLSTLLTGLSSISGTIRADELTHAFAKIRSIIPAEKAEAIELKANQICIDLSPWMGNSSIQPYLKIIREALQENRMLSFCYAGRKGTIIARTVQPCQLVLKSNHWYLHAFCRMRKDYRLFKLSRMTDLQLQEETFVAKEHMRPVLDFEETWGKIQTKITIRIHRSILERVLDFCPYGQFTPDGDEHYIVPFPFLENDYYYDILLGFGTGCECLKPDHVRTEMKRRISSLYAIYQDTSDTSSN